MKCNYTCKIKSVSQLLPKNVFKCLIIVLFFCTKQIAISATSNDTTPTDFVERCRRDCVIKRDAVVCGKYRVVRWLHGVASKKEFDYGPIKIIKIPKLTEETILPEFVRTRDFKFGMGDTLKFVREIVEDFIARRALVYTYEPDAIGSARELGSAPIILDEDELVQMQRGESDNWRLFKKKKSIIFPILILLNLIKLKLLLLPILLGVHLIKKLIIIGGLFVPGILSKLKICKVPQTHSHHIWATAAETPFDYPSGYGHEDAAWAHRNDIYPGGTLMGPSHSYHSPFSPFYRQR